MFPERRCERSTGFIQSKCVKCVFHDVWDARIDKTVVPVNTIREDTKLWYSQLTDSFPNTDSFDRSVNAGEASFGKPIRIVVVHSLDLWRSLLRTGLTWYAPLFSWPSGNMFVLAWFAADLSIIEFCAIELGIIDQIHETRKASDSKGPSRKSNEVDVVANITIFALCIIIGKECIDFSNMHAKTFSYAATEDMIEDIPITTKAGLIVGNLGNVWFVGN